MKLYKVGVHSFLIKCFELACCVLLYLLLCVGVKAQNQLNSPYSRFGVGDISSRSAASIMSMGGTAFAFQSSSAVNYANPAAYIAYDSLSCLFDAAFSFKNHTLTAASTQKGATMLFDYVAFGISVRRWWKTSLGFQPYSSMNYTVIEPKSLDSNTYNILYTGRGGINEVYWGNAFRLFKNFSLGFNVSYLFGSYIRQRQVEWDSSDFFNSLISRNNHVNGVALNIGTQYFIPVKDKGEIGIGLVCTPPIPIFSKYNQEIVTYIGTADAVTYIDTIYPQTESKQKHSMPLSIGGGLSWIKRDKYFVGIDVKWTNWSKYALDGQNDSLSDALKFSIGANITPQATGKMYFSRVTYSLGVSYELTHLKFNEQQLAKYAISAGLFFPIKRSKTGIGMIFEYGSLGTTSNGLIKEDYFSITLNLRIHERWYQRIKYE